MLSAGEMAPKVSQGVTTVVAGNCGISLSPMPGGMKGMVPSPLDLLDNEGKWVRFPTFGAYVEELGAHPAAANCALLVGHMTLRVATMDNLDRPATAAEIVRMRELVREALSAGAIGFSTGRTDNHRTAEGRWTPSSESGVAELQGDRKSVV